VAEPAPYQRAFDPDSSYGSAVRLVERIGATAGVVLDLGCGYGPVAEPLRDLGLTYVGLDLDPDGLADLAGRGFATSPLDLEQPAAALHMVLAAQLGDQPLVAVLALDALEHVHRPAEVVAAVTQLASAHAAAQLILSLPNVTHLDVAAKLLLGRWDVQPTGLLDHTHLQFFDERHAVSLATDAGWRPVERDDVTLTVTEQCDPADAPQLRPGSPLNDLLRSLRGDADGHGSTYQFVRSYSLSGGEAVAPSSAPAAESLFATVVVLAPPDELDRVAADLAAQTDRSFEAVVVGAIATDLPPDLPAAMGLAADAVHGVADAEDLDDVLLRSRGRYVCVVGPGERVAPGWLAEFGLAVDDAPGRVLVAGCTGADGDALPVARFDLISTGLTGVVPGVAYAVPRAAVGAGVIRYGAQLAHVVAGLAVAAMWCGRYDLPGVTCSSTHPEDLVHLDGAVARVLDQSPLVLAGGSAGPLSALHRNFVEAADRADQAQWALHELRVHHDAYVAASDSERADLHRRLARATTPWGAVALTGRRAASIVRRRLPGRS
jgi:2-polyprenyl-3-methyl-5-hydroxy-6-metoxy-1,4-benzoquinol methylase